MPWHARLQLDYTAEHNARTVARYEHNGPLRILQSLYPEGDAICHNVLVHPPGGLVGGDTLDITTTVGPGAHGLVTRPAPHAFTAPPARWPCSAATSPWLKARAWNGCHSKPCATAPATPKTTSR